MASSNRIHLKSMENDIIEISMEAALMSITIKDMFYAVEIDSEAQDGLEIPIETVSTKTLKKAVEWMTKWQDTPQPSSKEIHDKVAKTIDDWDKEFLEMELLDLYELVSFKFCLRKTFELKENIITRS